MEGGREEGTRGQEKERGKETGRLGLGKAREQIKNIFCEEEKVCFSHLLEKENHLLFRQ